MNWWPLNSITQSRGPVMRRFAIAVVVLLGVADFAAGQFEAGAAKIDITPPTGYPMWGYAARKPARYGVGSTETLLNRNRQSKRADAPVDRELVVLRVEDTDGKPIAHAVNFAAHPTMLPAELMKFSADYPGALAKHVEAE